MAGGKLILICQSGGEFLAKDDGSLSYKGGEAHAININHDTVFDDLKLKLAEMVNLEYKSLSLKYFIPGNRRTLITLSNDRDLKIMCEIHADSVTADIFVTGKEGFDREALNLHRSRACGIKLAETVTATSGSPAAGVVATATSINATMQAVSASGAAVAPAAVPTLAPTVSVMAISPTIQSPSRMVFASELSPANTATDDNGAAACLTPTKPASAPNNSTIVMDMSATPADTVKKRRRTASWKVGPNGPTIVTLADNMEDTRKNSLHEKNNKNSNAATTAADMEQLPNALPWIDNPNYSHNISDSHDAPMEKVVASWKDGITGVGQDFKSVKEFRDALQKYAIAHRFVYRLKKNDTNRASGRCIDENCSWRIHASWVPSAQVFRIKKMNESHTCAGESWKGAHPSKNWLVNIIKERLHENPHLKPKEITTGISKDFGIELNYTQVWRGIEDARKQLQGPRKEAYNQLPWFCGKILEANPGSSVKLCISDGKFQRLFLSFHASKHGFQHGCRPLLYLDSVSLKSKYHEMLLTATALDGNDNTFPVAFAMVDIENDDNWHWFLEQLRSAVTTTRSITFVSDKEKGLMKSVLEVFDDAHHGYSMYHLLENFRKNLRGPFHGDGKGSLIGNFLAAAHAVRLDGFKISTKQIERVSPKAYDWVMQIEPEYWTNALFKGEYYNQVLVDVTESYFNWIEEAKDLPILRKLEVLGCKMMELINTRRMDSSGWSTKLTPLKEEKLQEEVFKARDLKVFVSSSTLFEIHDDSINVVDIGKWECSCLRWKVTGLPCCHAIAAFNSTGKCTYDYCSRYFTVDSFRVTYSESINAVLAAFDSSSEEKTASEGGQVFPPSTPRPPSHENKRQSKTPGAAKRTVSCSKCQGEGHNKATCKEVF
ncbi:hypothetical protein HS088_TW04G01560 [Tripterygium wilfordii]|uniref:SWIM-type domain-containing protein n=1 Tax=Tripterygium wilfordii TaxID=458696 RepID=A0A7J7DTA2_TRIWF|nr:uncharacterized protein LOC119997505 [Tripterygium wilfordii]KAF5749590.1 hypothetical protein HS088_TW04G01560 [Tripterygium wilfordii]